MDEYSGELLNECQRRELQHEIKTCVETYLAKKLGKGAGPAGKMKALVYHGPENISLDEVPIPQILENDDVIIRVTTTTICGTDIHIWHGGMPDIKGPRVLGHEFCGEVVEAGPTVRNVKIGDRCAVSCITQCGECFYCRQGIYSHCTTGGWLLGDTIDGCQAEYVRVPHANLACHIIPEGLSDEDVLFVGDILSTGYFGAEKAGIQPGETVLVSGCGAVGICSMACAKLWGPSRVIAVDITQERLDFALKNGYADVGLNPKTCDLAEEVKKLTHGRGADRCIEAVGVAPTFQMALDNVRPGGGICVTGVFEKPFELAMNELWTKNISITMGLVDANHISALIDLIAAGRIDVKPLITHRAPLNDIVKGYDFCGNKKDGCIKWVVTPYKR